MKKRTPTLKLRYVPDDANGNMKYKVAGNGDSTVYEYDNRNREIKRTYAGGHSVETRYTEDGKPEMVIDHRGTTVYTYDNRGRQSNLTNPDNTFIESVYDLNGNRTEMTTPWGTTLYSYDKLNRMKSVTSPDNAVTTYFYNAVGNRDSVANANQTSTGYAYDNLNRLKNVTNYGPDGAISSFTYELNNAGIRTAVTELDGSRVEYAYDDLYRLIGETRTGSNPYSISYSYDHVGNRLTQNKNGVTTSYTYNDRDQLIQESSTEGTATYQYDAAGRMKSKTDQAGTTTYTWVDNDRMASVTGPSGAASYNYDAQGRRVSETSSSGSKNYLIDAQLPYGQVIAETDENGILSAEYVYGLERISQKRGSTFSIYQADGQGSVRQLTSEAGDVTDTWTYTAFGEIQNRTGTTENAFTYSGEQWDPNANFYYLRARWYDPSSGRFTSVDPYSGDPQAPVSLHRYLYSNVSPVSMRDPTGEFTLMGVMTTIFANNILASNVQAIPSNPMNRTYSLILYMLDYYDVGQDGKKKTNDDIGITGFPGPYYSNFLGIIQTAFEQENAKGKAKFRLVNTLGTKSFIPEHIGTSRYSAIISHGSLTFPDLLFPSLQELKDDGADAEHLTKKELNRMAKSGSSTGIFISACNAGHWADGDLSAISKSSTEIGDLITQAIRELYRVSKTNQ